ncbi:MAG TPA: [protein-PII] uridylyltransferase [Mycobacteriales bacterium]|nr:[protein-PII] uridylyltransferase [Mycobacteriales bacterium]
MTDDSSAALRDARASILATEGLTGAALRAALTEAADSWLTDRVCSALAIAHGSDASGVALVAVGGYGRREPAAGSDLDLLLLHHDGVEFEELANSIWYPVWDAGVGLDHSVRTVDEAIEVAREDLKAMLGLLDLRHVAGDETLTARLRTRIFETWRRDVRRRLPELVAAVQERGERCGELSFLLEPDLKDARGGLRDVQAMTAIALAWVADAPAEPVRNAYDWLLDVRGELHRRSPRGSDRLVKQEQLPIAATFGLHDADELMRRVFDAARTIAYATDEACRRALVASRPPRRWGRRGGVAPRRPLAEGVVEQDGEVHLARDADPANDPVLVLRVAAAAAQAALPIGEQVTKRLAQDCPPIPEPWPPEARDAFIALLGAGRPAVAAVEALDQAGLLVRLVPEWEPVRCKPQHNAVHRYTVDRHLIEAAVEAASLARQVARPDLLLLGSLLHDIGKGFPGDHTEAGVERVPVIARRIGLSDEDADIVTDLVRHHLLLPDTATRRDLSDPATIDIVTRAVGDVATLELLHALTIADAAATGPAAWSDWKAGLITELVRRASAAMAGEHLPEYEATTAEQRSLAHAGELGVDLSGSQLTIVAPDRPGLLSRWAGVAALHRLAIRSATATSVSTDAGRMAVTVLEVAPKFGSLPDLDALAADVRRAFDDNLPLADRLREREQAYRDGTRAVAPPLVLWFDEESHHSTIVEVRTHDADGLLHRLTKVLADERLDVRSARVQTLGAEVVDAFYVVDVNGKTVDDAQRRLEIEAALIAAC